MSIRALIGVMLGLAVVFGGGWARAANLIPDPSFEAPIPTWFSGHAGSGCSVEKEPVVGASDGRQVLALSGWSESGSTIASGPIPIEANTLSGSVDIRSFGGTPEGLLELALYDVAVKEKIASLGTARLDGRGKWSTIRMVGVAVGTKAKEAVLAITVKGGPPGMRAEVDKLGLFPGRHAGVVTDGTEFTSFEAESMGGNGHAWKLRDDFRSWYSDFPSQGKMLSGSDPVGDADNQPTTMTLRVRTPGRFTLWTRFLRTNVLNHAAFTISLRQQGRVVASLEVQDDSDAKWGGKPLSWVFVPLPADLVSGPVEVALTRPASAASWITRKVDLFVLTNLGFYQPKIEDFRTQGYMRFTNEGDVPFCLALYIRRHQGPVYETRRMWTVAGLEEAHSCPMSARFLPAAPSPWVKITDYLSPAAGHNNMALLATTQSSNAGYVAGQLKGRLEFSVGGDHRLVKAIHVDQAAPQILLTLDVSLSPSGVQTAADYIVKEQSVVAGIKSTSRPRAKHLDLSVILGGLDAELEPSDIVEKEVAIVKALGFNATYSPLTQADTANNFYQTHDLQHVGIWGARPIFHGGDPNEPDRVATRLQWQTIAKKYGPLLGRIERAKVYDEPAGMTYAALVASPFSRVAFPSWLKARGVSLGDLGVATWSDAIPMGPEQGNEHPRLFYWTAMYRLSLLANAAKATVEAKRAAGVPDNVKTYANYDPTWGNGSFTQAGVDPFFMQRDGGFEMGWTEDWLGYGASVQQLSDQAAVIRAAGAPTHQELGMYVIGVDGPPSLQRQRLYEALAAGARHICSYNYGPYYASIDSWGARYEVYPYISDVLHDFGAIDEALYGTTRRKADVAILYNRAAAIWAGRNTTMEQDGRYIFWALAHAGYQPDFIPEEDVEHGGLERYKVLYALGTQMRKSTANAIASWVATGGAVFGTAGTGSHDEYDQPMDVLDAVFGAHSAALSLVADAGRPKYELRTLRPLDVLQTVPGHGVPQVAFNRLCAKEALLPTADAAVILKDPTGAAAGVMHSYHKGTAVRIAALPGVTYANDAVKDKAYDIESYHPTNYRPELRNFITFLPKLAGAERIETNAPLVEVARYDASDRTVLVVVNHGAPVPNFHLTLADASSVVSSYSATGTAVQVHALPHAASDVSFDLGTADAVVLKREASTGGVGAALRRIAAPRCGCRLATRSAGAWWGTGLAASGLAWGRRRKRGRARLRSNTSTHLQRTANANP